MKNKNEQIDAYIERAEPFAKPVLKHLRKLVHKANPHVEEKIKWGMPFFDYKGPFCNMASFKNHVVFGFWKSSLINDPNKYLGERASNGGEAMGNLGRITSIEDLPPDEVIIDFLMQAKQLNDKGIKLPAKERKPNQELEIPDDFLNSLKRNKKAMDIFEGFPPSAKRDYAEWITEAKSDKTREQRMATAIEWISEGKRRNWKYEKPAGK